MHKKNIFCICVLSSVITIFFLPYVNDAAAESEFFQYERELKERVVQMNSPANFVFAYMLGLVAIREDDPHRCDSLDTDKQSCGSALETVWYLRKMAEHKCDQIGSADRSDALNKTIIIGDQKFNEMEVMQQFCENLDDCDGQLWSEQKDMCDGLQSGNLSLFKKGHDAFIIKMGYDEETSTDTYRLNWGVFQGFKNGGSQSACEKYASGLDGASAYICEVLFSKAPVDEILDAIADDLTFFLLAEKYHARSFCNRINKAAVREGCREMLEFKKYFFYYDY